MTSIEWCKAIILECITIENVHIVGEPSLVSVDLARMRKARLVITNCLVDFNSFCMILTNGYFSAAHFCDLPYATLTELTNFFVMVEAFNNQAKEPFSNYFYVEISHSNSPMDESIGLMSGLKPLVPGFDFLSMIKDIFVCYVLPHMPLLEYAKTKLSKHALCIGQASSSCPVYDFPLLCIDQKGMAGYLIKNKSGFNVAIESISHREFVLKSFNDVFVNHNNFHSVEVLRNDMLKHIDFQPVVEYNMTNNTAITDVDVDVNVITNKLNVSYSIPPNHRDAGMATCHSVYISARGSPSVVMQNVTNLEIHCYIQLESEMDNVIRYINQQCLKQCASQMEFLEINMQCSAFTTGQCHNIFNKVCNYLKRHLKSVFHLECQVREDYREFIKMYRTDYMMLVNANICNGVATTELSNALNFMFYVPLLERQYRPDHFISSGIFSAVTYIEQHLNFVPYITKNIDCFTWDKREQSLFVKDRDMHRGVVCALESLTVHCILSNKQNVMFADLDHEAKMNGLQLIPEPQCCNRGELVLSFDLVNNMMHPKFVSIGKIPKKRTSNEFISEHLEKVQRMLM